MKSILALWSRIKPTTRFGRFSFFTIVGNAALWLIELVAHLPASGLWRFLLKSALLIVLIRYACKVIGWIMQKLIWRLRRRLLVTYALIGIVPVLLLFLIMLGSGYFFFGHLARFFVRDGIEHLTSDLEATNRAMMVPFMEALQKFPNRDAEEWTALLSPLLDSVGSRSSRVWIDGQSGGRRIALEFSGGRIAARTGEQVKPAWLKEATAGIFEDGDTMFLVSYIPRASRPGYEWLLLSLPLDATALRSISERTQVSIYPWTLVRKQGGPIRLGDKQYAYGPVSADLRVASPLNVKQSWFDHLIRFPHLLNTSVWETGQPSGEITPLFFLNVESTWWRLARRLFSAGSGIEGDISVVFLVSICVVFLMIEIVALVSVVLMARTITGAVHNLDDGARHILRGDFSHRIPVKSRDQLGSLSETFNTMTASIERLLKEETEKQRLESELTIAREVQQHLFPREAPRLRRLQMSGRCQPARTVSGDYYDYLMISPTTMGIALGDVSGKGVSAALLMASLQAALRSHLGIVSGGKAAAVGNLSTRAGNSEVAVASQVAEAVASLNQQLYQNTPIEKYATFFYGVYEEPGGWFTYTNAGHLPPLVFTAGGVQRLETGGTVVGLFADVEYEQSRIRFSAGDVMVAYTDGITEAENPKGEQFGEERLIGLVSSVLTKPPDRIVADILRAVSDWVGPGEPQDDMTLIVTKAT
ncbi:MAG: SpoIIE family protein phosphatase [Acidobacteria bacterium]|nr:SpoIIE family protein phosphatase [Acidobacteriota bacterium]MBI3656594.1 SpoIIE family protein phosphatase [Acidobacteriota bacterium]